MSALFWTGDFRPMHVSRISRPGNVLRRFCIIRDWSLDRNCEYRLVLNPLAKNPTTECGANQYLQHGSGSREMANYKRDGQTDKEHMNDQLSRKELARKRTRKR